MDINNNMGAQAQRDLLDKLGIKSAEEVKNNSRDTLGQEEFLTLMTAQLQNQDPMEPMDNGDFIAQMAQFSTCLLYTSPSPRDISGSRMPSSA